MKKTLQTIVTAGLLLAATSGGIAAYQNICSEPQIKEKSVIDRVIEEEYRGENPLNDYYSALSASYKNATLY